MLERKDHQQLEAPDKFIDPAASVEMTVRDLVVRPSALTAPMVLVLPPVSEAAGMFFSIVVRAADPVNTITVTDRDDSECWVDVILNSKCDPLLMYSDGMFWHRLANITSTFPSGYDYP